MARHCASSRLALDDCQIVPPIENGRRTLSLVRAGKDSAVFADDLPFGGDDDTLGIDPHADRGHRQINGLGMGRPLQAGHAEFP